MHIPHAPFKGPYMCVGVATEMLCLQCDEETHRLTLLRFVQHHQKLLHKMKQINSSGQQLKNALTHPKKQNNKETTKVIAKG
jgi:hypothetical protein